MEKCTDEISDDKVDCGCDNGGDDKGKAKVDDDDDDDDDADADADADAGAGQDKERRPFKEREDRIRQKLVASERSEFQQSRGVASDGDETTTAPKTIAHTATMAKTTATKTTTKTCETFDSVAPPMEPSAMTKKTPYRPEVLQPQPPPPPSSAETELSARERRILGKYRSGEKNGNDFDDDYDGENRRGGNASHPAAEPEFDSADVAKSSAADPEVPVAMAVDHDAHAEEEEEVRRSIPSAVQINPHASKPPELPDPAPSSARPCSSRRFRVCALLAIVVVAVVIAVLSAIIPRKKSNADADVPTRPNAVDARTRAVLGKLQHIAGDAIYEEGTPHHEAIAWLIERDPLRLDIDSPFLEQRYLIALFYYSTDRDKAWEKCPPAQSEDIGGGDNDNDDCNATTWDYADNEINGTYKRLLSGHHECDWYGIRCNEDNTVREIDYAKNKLTGSLPSEIALLPSLQRLSLLWNELTGTIPSEYGLVAQIADFEVHYNLLTGTIPDTLYRESRLLRLNLGNNLLSGTVSTELGRLKNVKSAFFFDNLLEGSIPTEIGLMNRLSYTWWQRCHFDGTIPTEIGHLSNLADFVVHANNITGTIPTEIGRLSLLEEIWFYSNRIYGSIPTEIYRLSNLKIFDGGNNALTGTIDTRISKLTNLVTMNLTSNFFTGTIPTELAQLPNITRLLLDRNDFEGNVTDAFCDLYDPPFKLKSLSADCGPTDSDGPPVVGCACCTACCDTVQETCYDV